MASLPEGQAGAVALRTAVSQPLAAVGARLSRLPVPVHALPGRPGLVHLRLSFHHLRFSLGAVLILSLASAAAYGLAAVLQHQAAVREPAELSMTAGLLVQLARRPLWLVGNALDIVGFLLQFVALRQGSLALVEPVLVLSLVFALPVSAGLARRRVRPGELGAAALVAGGLGLFLGVGRPGAGHPHATLVGWAALAVVVAAVVLACTQGARGGSPRRAALLLAAGAGISFGYVAALTERAGHQLDRGLVHTFTTWTPYAMILAAVAALLLTQSAFQAGELRLSLPTLTIAQPVVAIAIGQALFGEHLRTVGLAPLWEALGMALMCLGVFTLARPGTVGAVAPADDGAAPER